METPRKPLSAKIVKIELYMQIWKEGEDYQKS